MSRREELDAEVAALSEAGWQRPQPPVTAGREQDARETLRAAAAQTRAIYERLVSHMPPADPAWDYEDYGASMPPTCCGSAPHPDLTCAQAADLHRGSQAHGLYAGGPPATPRDSETDREETGR